MKKALLLIIATSFLTHVKGQVKNFIDQPYIETNARVDTSVVPDKITLSIFISEADTKKGQSVEDLEKQMATTLTAIGIDIKKQLSLADLSSNFKKYFLQKKRTEKVKSYFLIVNDAQTAGIVIQAMEKMRISSIDIHKTEFENEDELRIRLKSEALLKAKRQASAMAAAIDQNIGRALLISDLRTETVNLLQGKVAGVRIRGGASRQAEFTSIPIEFEKIKIVSEVTVKFALE